MRRGTMKLCELEIPDSFPAIKQINSLKKIFQIINLQYEIVLRDKDNMTELEIISKIRLLSSEIYSACEVINQMLIHIYRNDERYRGSQLTNGFNSNLKKIYKSSIEHSREVVGVYNDIFVHTIFDFAISWYIDIHDIRTQETHYEVGEVYKDNGTINYINGNRNGTSKNLYSNPSNEINITIDDFLLLVHKFLETEGYICNGLQYIL